VHRNATLGVAAKNRRCRVSEAVSVARLHPSKPGLHRIQKRRRAGSFASVMRHQQHIGAQRCTTVYQGGLLGSFNVAHQQGSMLST
jgi:hypothetical protein